MCSAQVFSKALVRCMGSGWLDGRKKQGFDEMHKKKKARKRENSSFLSLLLCLSLYICTPYAVCWMRGMEGRCVDMYANYSIQR